MISQVLVPMDGDLMGKQLTVTKKQSIRKWNIIYSQIEIDI